MAFSAADVKNLREMTGVGMMDCKKALTAADGDIDKAVQKFKDMYMKFLINLKVVQDDSSQEKLKNAGKVNQTTRLKKIKPEQKGKMNSKESKKKGRIALVEYKAIKNNSR